MSQCNCSEDSFGATLEANPDVAGIGVLVSFVLASTVTFLAIVAGWLTDSIPKESLNGVDHFMIQQTRKFLHLPAIVTDSSSKSYLESKHIRTEALERFVLSLSDQQLVTGIAILIAGYVNPCSMDYYHFGIVAALAWFSSTTHLSTLAVLRRYLIEHPHVRTWRVVGMIITLLGLLLAQFYVYGSGSPSSPAFCGLYQLEFGAPLTILMLCGVVLFLTFSYANNFMRLYSNDSDISMVDWAFDKMERKTKYRNASSALVELSTMGASFVIANQDRKAWKRKKRNARLAERLEICMANRSRFSKLCRLFFVLQTVQAERSESFLSQILWLVFGNAYGIVQVVIARLLIGGFQVIGNENEMGFGQIVPLLLMVLPLLAVREVYDDVNAMKRKSSSNSAAVSNIKDRISTGDVSPKTLSCSDEPFGPPNRTDPESGLSSRSLVGRQASRAFAQPSESLQTVPLPTRASRQIPEASRGLVSEALEHPDAFGKGTPQLSLGQEKEIDPYEIPLFKKLVWVLTLIDLLVYIVYACALNGVLAFEGIIATMAFLSAIPTLDFLTRLFRLLHMFTGEKQNNSRAFWAA